MKVDLYHAKENDIRYEDIELHNRIGLKGMIENDPDFEDIKIGMLVFGFKQAVEFMLHRHGFTQADLKEV